MITRNQDNINAVLDYIEAHPDEHDQGIWHSACGTAHCFAGHAEVRAGYAPQVSASETRRIARQYYGFMWDEANYYFAVHRTLEELRTARLPWVMEDGYHRDGYHRDGYHRDGYHRDGYHRDGYHRDGYHRDGYDRDGLDRNNNARPLTTQP